MLSLEQLFESGVNLEFNNINFEIKNEKTILSNVSGSARSSRFLGILGTSGAGKTSLLNILAGRLRSTNKYNVNGEIKINGEQLFSTKAFKQQSAYIEQENFLFETLKVRETFDLSSKLVLPKIYGKEKRDKKVDGIINALGLKKCEDSLVGGQTIRGLSGGERKRVSIGKELITNPSIIFIDEPTSGLDSYTAYKIIKLIVEIAHLGRTVICTIHQPSSEIFKLFDDVMVLSEGKVIYNGPSKDTIDVFEKLGYPIPENSNPADHFLNVCNISKENKTNSIDSIALGFENLKKNYNFCDKSDKKMNLEPLKYIKSDRPGIISQIGLLAFKRSLINIFRQPYLSYFRLLNSLFFAIMITTLFFRLGYDARDSSSRRGALFFSIVGLMFNTMLSVVLTFPKEKEIFLNETSNGMYTPFSYFISKILIEMPFNLIVTIVFQLAVYWAIGFNNSALSFFTTLLILATGSEMAYFIGMFIGAIAPSSELAIPMTSLIMLPSMLYSGLFILPDQMKSWISWVTYINFMRYLLDMIVYNEFKAIKKIKSCINNVCTEISGLEYLKNFNLNDLNFWLWYGLSLIFLTFFMCLSYLILEIKAMRNYGKPIEKNAPINNSKME